MATFDVQPAFLAAVGNGQSGSGPSSGQDEFYQFRRSETVTLSTAGTTTDTSENLLPAGAVILGITATITTALAGAGVTGITIGDASTAARFATLAETAAGKTVVGTVAMKGSISTDATGPTQASAAKIRITATGGTPSAGAVRVTVFGWYGVPTAS